MMMSVSAHAESKMLGDVDGDGEITITDATFIQRYTVGIKTPVAVTSSVADIDATIFSFCCSAVCKDLNSSSSLSSQIASSWYPCFACTHSDSHFRSRNPLM